MAERVFLHLGVPKSGTTYLQTTIWQHVDGLRARGVLLPGDRHAHHRWASYFVREQTPESPEHGRRLAGAWDRLRAEVSAWEGTAVVSHEFYGAATAQQAARTIAALAPAEVHVVVTARDALSLLTAAWQETLKYRSTTELDDFDTGVSDDPMDVWDWRNLDASEVLSRWAPTLGPERVHVVVVPRQRTSEPVLWRRFAGLFVDDADAFEPSDTRNESMGVVESELLRRVSAHLGGIDELSARMRLIRDYLAEQKLVPRHGERFHPGPQRVGECRRRSERMVQRIREAGYHVVGDLEDLVVPDELPVLRTPRDVTGDELAEAASSLVAEVLTDLDATQGELRSSRRTQSRLRRQLEATADASGPRREGTPSAPSAPSAPSTPSVLRRVVTAVRRT